ncbi:MAG: class I SAM-dependent methyltransferase [Spirochaetes bacterium]|nr:class I SAM-dependent methyltransferase [Spirochaetota bacterium]
MQNEPRNFDDSAQTWDEKPRRIQLARDVFRSMAAAVTIARGMRALDFGCGTGLLSLQVLELTGAVTCADSSGKMLDVLEKKAGAAGLSGVTTLHLTSDDGDGLKGSYDLITSSMTFHHVRNVPPLVMRLAGHLNPGGTLCVADLDPDGGTFHQDTTGVFHNGFPREVMVDYFRGAGLVDVQSSTAAIVERNNESGETVTFTLFLVTGRKP